MDILGILNYYGLISENSEVVDSYVKISCPFHKEGVASFSIRIDNGICHCFGCGWKGSFAKFISKMEDCNELQALIFLRHNNFELKKMSKPRQSSAELLEGAFLQYESLPMPNWYKRLKNYMIRKRKFKPKILTDFGVKIEASRRYPIMVPIYDNYKFCGLLRRRVDDIEDRKYLNSKGFQKKKTLGGRYKEGKIMITEGYFDAMMAWQFGYKNVACLFSWSPSKIQIEKIKAKTNIIISALDNTPKGDEGNAKLIEAGIKVIKFAYPDDVKDICDMNKYSFKRSLYNS